jgi:hypothetical protein
VPSHEDIAHQRDQLDANRRRLAILLRQLAGFGGLHAPPAVFEDIRKARREIARIKVEALPDDLDPQDATASVSPRRMRVFIRAGSGGVAAATGVGQRGSGQSNGMQWFIARRWGCIDDPRCSA